MNKLRVAVIGCGRISNVYREAFHELSDEIQVVGAADKVLERAEKFASEFPGCKPVETLEELLAEKPDVVHVMTPHFLHHDHVVASLRAGCHVLTEKPVAITTEDAADMIAEAKKSGRLFGVISQNRYLDGIQKAKELIRSGAFGKITGAWSSLNWHRPPSYYECDWKGSWAKEGGGVVIDQAIHSIDLVRYLVGQPVRRVIGHIDRRILTQIEVEDVADAMIQFEDGVVYSFYACNYYTHNAPIRVEVEGENGRMLLVGDTVTLTLNGKEEVIRPVVSSSGQFGYWGNCHQQQIQSFYHSVREGTPIDVTPEDATETLRVVLSIYQSSRENREIDPREV